MKCVGCRADKILRGFRRKVGAAAMGDGREMLTSGEELSVTASEFGRVEILVGSNERSDLGRRPVACRACSSWR